MQLRPYQLEAIEAAEKALARGQHPVIAIATGGGKSVIIAELCRRVTGRVLIVSHRKELLEQDAGEILSHDPSQQIGIYSAGLLKRETRQRVIVAGVASIYQRMDVLQQAGPFAYIVIDESHLVAPQNAETKMYNALFAAAPKAQRIGLSATPYRLSEGLIYGPPPCWFDTLAYESNIRSLTPEYLSPLKGMLTAHNVNVEGVRTRQGDYVVSDLSQAACQEQMVEGALDEICQLAANRDRWLLFCVDVAHTELVTERLRMRHISAEMVTQRTPRDERRAIVQGFRQGSFRALVNCLVFKEGFNVPSVDMVALLRPTQSKGLVIQQIGRGSRQSPDKKDCLVLDFAGNFERHAPLDELVDVDKSPQRAASDAAVEERRRAADERQREWQAKHSTKASTHDPFDAAPVSLVREVLRTSYSVEPSRKFPGKQNLVVSYLLDGQPRWARSWVCLEYPGGAKYYASQWFKRRQRPMPETAMQALQCAIRGEYPAPHAVVLVPDGKYMRIALEHFLPSSGDLFGTADAFDEDEDDDAGLD